MAIENTVQLTGNAVDEPELKFTPNGAAVANFRMAVTPRIREGDAWKDGETSFFRVNVWRQMAENVAESIQKGTRVVVIGKLKVRSWETPEGDKRSVTEVEADEVCPSLKFATAKVEKASRSGQSRGQDASPKAASWNRDPESKPTAGGEFSEPPPF
jgi:single-strand DNA-binding protein